MKVIKSIDDLAINGAAPAFVDALHVGRPNVGDRELFLEHVGEILDTGYLSNDGPKVRELERQIAGYHDVKHCVAVCNGTVALEIAIRALELEGEVIVPSFTFVATAHSLYWQAITPVFADIDPVTHNLDPIAVKRMITPRTTGIIGVHLWGRPSPVEELQKIADENDLDLIFDAAHAFGCSYKGTKIGNFGACEILSFHATKFFNTFEGGAILTNNDDLAAAMRLMRNFGFSGKDNVIYPGTNGKMIEIAAAMGLVNLNSIEKVIKVNKRNYRAYSKELLGVNGVNLLEFNDSQENNYQYIVVEIDDSFAVNRDKLVEALCAENILARKYFWPGCHNMKPYSELYPHAGMMLPNTQVVAGQVMVLPSGTAVSIEMISVVVSVIKTFL